MNIIVTGGAGFIGSNLVCALLERGESVSVIDDFNDYYDPALKRDNIAKLQDNPLFTLFEVDIRNKDDIEKVLRKARPQVICHLAARAGVRPSIEAPLLYEEVNCGGTLNVLEAARSAGIELTNFVFASSSSVYGARSRLPFTEKDPVSNPISPYAATKRSSELMLFTYHHLYGLPVTCLRFFTVYGERGRPDMAVAKFTKLINDGAEIPVYGDGSARRDFTYIGDIIDGVVSSVYTPMGYEIINLGESRTIELSYLISVIEDKLGKKARIKYLSTVAGDVPVTNADIDKARALLDYDP